MEEGDETGGASAAGKKKQKRRKKFDKGDLVRQAMDALEGLDTKNQDILDWIKKYKKVNVSPSHVSNIKTELRQGKGGPAPANGPVKKKGPAPAGRLDLEQMRFLAEIIQQVGRDGVHEIVDLFKE